LFLVAPKKRSDVVTQDSQFIALGKRSQDEVEEVIEKDSSSSSQRERPTKANPYATVAKFFDYAELFKKPFGGSSYAYGDPFCKEISKLGVKSLELPAKAIVVSL
jgi:hypothetical protein